MFKKDSPVLYKKSCAVIQDFDGDKIIVKFQVAPATPTGKKAQYATQKVREKDIISLNAETCGSIEKLLSFTDESIDSQIRETYELLVSDESTASAPVTFSDLTELLRGSTKSEESWFIYSSLCASLEFSLNEEELKNGTISFIPRNQTEIESIKQKNTRKNTKQKYTPHSLLALRNVN